MKLWKRRLARRSAEEVCAEEPTASNSGTVGPVPVPIPHRDEWTEDRQLSFLVLLLLTSGAVYLVYIIFRPFLQALAIGVVMAIAFFPLHTRIANRVHSTTLAALITTTFAVLIILLPFTLVSARLAMQTISNYPRLLDRLNNTASLSVRWDPLIERVAEQTGMPESQLRAEITARARDWASRLVTIAGSVAQTFAQQIMTILLGSVFLFWLLVESNELSRGITTLLPLPPHRVKELSAAVNQGIIANIYGLLAIGVLEGTLIGIGFWFAGLRSPLIWTAVAVAFSVLPYLGVSLVWVPACIVLAFYGHWLNASLLCVWCLLVVSATDGVIRSTFISRRVKANSLLITLSLMGGVAVFGPVGFFVGPVVVVVLGSLLRILREEHATVRGAEDQAA